MTLLIGDKLVVSMHYTLTDDEGTVIDSSQGGAPLSYLHGAGNIIPGLENALTGKSEGAELSVTVAPEEGYGEINPDLCQKLPMDAFEHLENLEVGAQLVAQTPEGQQLLTVVDIQEGEVTIDANHPLAGKTLHFAVEVLGVRDATAQELEHGHVHEGGQEQ